MTGLILDLLHLLSIAKETHGAALAGHIPPVLAASVLLTLPFLWGLNSYQRALDPHSNRGQALHLGLVACFIVIFVTLSLIDPNDHLVSPLPFLVMGPYFLGLAALRVSRSKLRWTLVVVALVAEGFWVLRVVG